MNAELFIDSNTRLYAFISHPGEEEKQRLARHLIEAASRRVISSQVVAEVGNNLLRKGGMTEAQVLPIIDDFYRGCEVRETDWACHRRASQLRSTHQFSFWDSLIVASAIGAGCATLLTEDMQHGQSVGGFLRIVNPFLPPPW